MTTIPVAILAAGRGSRLGALTDARPKCLLALGGASPLSLALDALDGCAGVGEVLVVVGHAREAIERFLESRPRRAPVRLLDNPRYDTANNIYSTHLLRDHARDGLLLLNSDVVCHPAILREAASAAGSFLVVDESRPIREEAMKVRFAGDRLEAIGKPLDPATAHGEYIGVCRLDAGGAAAFFRRVAEILGEGGDGEWYEAAIGRAARDVAVGCVPTAGRPWIEIDDPSDLARARNEILPRIAGEHLR